jgi:hypothetical protein
VIGVCARRQRVKFHQEVDVATGEVNPLPIGGRTEEIKTTYPVTGTDHARIGSGSALREFPTSHRTALIPGCHICSSNAMSLRLLADEVAVQDEATKAADESETIALNQYKSGVVSYLMRASGSSAC